MPWEHKVKLIHRNIIEYMRETVTHDFTTSWSFQKEYTIMMRHVMCAESVIVESELSQKARQMLVVKKINQRLIPNQKNSVIFCGIVRMATDDLKDFVLANDRGKNIKMDSVYINLKMNSMELFLVD